MFYLMIKFHHFSGYYKLLRVLRRGFVMLRFLLLLPKVLYKLLLYIPAVHPFQLQGLSFFEIF